LFFFCKNDLEIVAGRRRKETVSWQVQETNEINLKQKPICVALLRTHPKTANFSSQQSLSSTRPMGAAWRALLTGA
jgi:hypothetical protein